MTVDPLFSTGWLLLNTGAPAIGADVPAAACTLARLKHDALPLPPRHCARVAGDAVSPVSAAHGDAAEGAGTPAAGARAVGALAVGAVGELAQAIEAKATAPATSVRTTRAMCLLGIRAPFEQAGRLRESRQTT